jgi:hypothetical protein
MALAVGAAASAASDAFPSINNLYCLKLSLIQVK